MLTTADQCHNFDLVACRQSYRAVGFSRHYLAIAFDCTVPTFDLQVSQQI